MSSGAPPGKTFKCYLCAKDFTRNDNLTRHLRSTHKEAIPRQRRGRSNANVVRELDDDFVQRAMKTAGICQFSESPSETPLEQGNIKRDSRPSEKTDTGQPDTRGFHVREEALSGCVRNYRTYQHGVDPAAHLLQLSSEITDILAKEIVQKTGLLFSVVVSVNMSRSLPIDG
jgi:hypothetical protein